mgnify:CR=1 FL=1
MLDPKILRETPEIARKACQMKNVTTVDVDHLHALATRRPAIIQELENLRAEKNRVSDEVAKLKKSGGNADALIANMKSIGPRMKALEEEQEKVEQELNEKMLMIPNLPHESVKPGGEEANMEVASWGEKRSYDFEPKPHWDLATALDILDFDRAAKISGSGFPLYKGLGARLERALYSYFLDLHTGKHGYTEWFTPYLVNRDSMIGTGQLPKMAEDMYGTDKGDDLWLIPTAEVSVTNLLRKEIIEEADLPKYFTGYSACFRREAGSAGKDTRGITRVHQFNKVELVKFVKPETSYDELEKLRANAETVLRNLGLHYRVLQLAAGDTSFAAAKCYDLEVWAPGMGRYLEVSSCSNFESFQARRANIRYRRADGKIDFLHTLNGSGLACPRAWIAVVENYQQKDGSVVIPEVLRPYMGGLEIIRPGK